MTSNSSSPEDPRGRALTDADMPDIEALDEESSYADFLSSGVSEALRRKALRKLFHAATFNTCDGLDDYAEDYTTFEKLGDVLTADMRHRMEMEEARKQAESPQRTDNAVAGDADDLDPDEADIVVGEQGADTVPQTPDEVSTKQAAERAEDITNKDDGESRTTDRTGKRHA